MERRCESFLLALVTLLCLTATSMAQQNPFIGTWQGSYNLNGMQVSVQTVMMPDWTFTSLSQSAVGAMRISGNYRVINANTIEFVNTNYEPREQCLPGADYRVHCTPLMIPPRETDNFRFLNATTLLIQSILPGMAPIQYTKVQ